MPADIDKPSPYWFSQKSDKIITSLVKLGENNEETIRAGLKELIHETRLDQRLKQQRNVLIKPNFTLDTYKPGVTTSPLVLKLLVEQIHSFSENITIIEGNGGSYLFSADEAARNHGVFDLTREYGVNWTNVSKLETEKVTRIINKRKMKLALPRQGEFQEPFLISVPVFKNHCMTRVTLGIKNLWGLVPSELRMLHHSNINRYLPLIGEHYNHQFTIIDGTIGLEGNGPMFGDAIELRTLLASSNAVIGDVIATWLMKIDPQQISHISEYARHRGTRIEDIVKQIPSRWSNYQEELKMIRTPSNYLDLLTFKSFALSKVVFDSPLTPMIYFLFNLVNGDRKSITPKKLKKLLEERS